MDHIRVIEIINKQIEDLENIQLRNTVLVPGVLAGTANLKELRRRIEVEVETGKPVQILDFID